MLDMIDKWYVASLDKKKMSIWKKKMIFISHPYKSFFVSKIYPEKNTISLNENSSISLYDTTFTIIVSIAPLENRR